MAQKVLNGHWAGKTALITGASSGIGAAVARRLAREGLRVVLVARRADRLGQLVAEITAAGGQAQAIAADLSCEADRLRLAEQAGRLPGGVQILVNNAGQGWFGYFAEMPWEVAHSLLEVDVTAFVQLTRLLLPGMLARGEGRIINIGSMVGGFPNQGVAIYSASKAFMDALTTSLYRELVKTPVKVSVLRPGPVASEFFQASAARTGSGTIPGKDFAIPPEAVASAVWSLLRRPRRVAYVPWILWVTPWFELLFGWLVDLLGPLLLQQKPGEKE
jgi:uncharacterized protein